MLTRFDFIHTFDSLLEYRDMRCAHEAGHAILLDEWGCAVVYAEVPSVGGLTRGMMYGTALWDPILTGQTLIAGHEAVRMLDIAAYEGCNNSDLRRMRAISGWFGLAHHAFVARCSREAGRVLRRRQRELVRVAEALDVRRVLEAGDIEALLDPHRRQRRAAFFSELRERMHRRLPLALRNPPPWHLV